MKHITSFRNVNFERRDRVDFLFFEWFCRLKNFVRFSSKHISIFIVFTNFQRDHTDTKFLRTTSSTPAKFRGKRDCSQFTLVS